VTTRLIRDHELLRAAARVEQPSARFSKRSTRQAMVANPLINTPEAQMRSLSARLAALTTALLAVACTRASAQQSASLRPMPKTDAGPPVSVALLDTLERLERKSWEAWKSRDPKYFEQFLSDDHVEVGFSGPYGKSVVVAGVGGTGCVVSSYTVDNFKVTSFDAHTAVLTYHAAQDTKCGASKVPSPVWVTSLYLNRDGKWWNALYQQTQDLRK
jgi:hypothetical protein